jgi:two-component system, OmpR family, phosphate regulon response regulator PhoB
MPSILVIEDEPDLRDVLDFNLRQAGHEVQLAGRAGEGLKAAKQRLPDLVILDLMLPDRPGTEVCRELRGDPATRAIPIMMLTARGEEIDRVVGFELGADDYVTKPFSMRELLLRIQAILRRAKGEVEESTVVRFGRLKIDKAAHRVWVDDREVELTSLEFKLLVMLHERKNRVQTRESLLEEVWGLASDITTRTVDTHVKRLREKLGEAADYIETVRGAGYRFADEPGEAAMTR